MRIAALVRLVRCRGDKIGSRLPGVAVGLLTLSCITTMDDLKPEQRMEQCRTMRPPLEAVAVHDYRHLGPSLPELSFRPISVDLRVTVDAVGTIQTAKFVDGSSEVISLQNLRGLHLVAGIGKPLRIDFSLNTMVPYQARFSPGWRLDVLLRKGDRLTCPPN